MYFHVLGQKSQNSSSVDGEGSVKQEIDQLQIENNLMPWADSNSKAEWTMGFICIYYKKKLKIDTGTQSSIKQKLLYNKMNVTLNIATFFT